MAERVVLVDGSSLIYRAFYALPRLTTSGGLHTNAVFGFATMFAKVLAGRTPAYGAVVFDPPGPTQRDALYPGYKSSRPAMPGELREQLPWIDRVVETFRFPVVRVPGYEADDVIGTLARRATEAGHDVVIVSGDKDFAQLVDERVRMLDTMRDVTYDPEVVRKKWGVRPEQMASYLALLGDKVDDIPGVPGIGAKGARRLLAEHADLEAVLAAGDDLKGRPRKALAEHAEQARLSLALATIDRDVPLGLGLEDLRLAPPGWEAVNALYRELQFYSLLSDEERAKAAVGGGDDAVDYAAVADPEAARAALGELVAAAAGAGRALAVHPVFDRPWPGHGPLAGLAFAAGPGRARYVPLRAPAHRADLAADPAWAFLRELLTDPAAPKVAHDVKVLSLGLRRDEGVALAGAAFDLRLASYLVDPTRLLPHRLDQLVKEYLHRTVRPRKELTGGGRSEKAWSALDLADAAEQACHLADAVAALHPVLAERLAEAGLERHLREHELPLAFVLGEMERLGIRVDPDDLAALGVELRERLAGYEARIHDLAGRPFNVNSTKQLSAVLFDELGLPVIKRTKTGYSTAVDVLERLAPEHEIARLVLEQRKLAKLIHTYTDVLQRELDPETGRIHAAFQQTASATGRLITTQPDLQRTPVKTEEGARIRRAFVPADGCRLLSADWSQIELRVLAHVSGDPLLVEAFARGLDVHARTASELFGCAVEDVAPEQRRVAKAVNFATIYGQGATALGQQLGVPRREAKRYIDGFFRAYAGVREWLDRTIATASESGYVTTLLGRRRYIPELKSGDAMLRTAGERIAANTPNQGTVADLCKLVMLRLPERLAAAGLGARMVLQVHDELVLEVPEAEVEPTAALVREVMERPVGLRVPLVVDVGVGRSWAEAHA